MVQQSDQPVSKMKSDSNLVIDRSILTNPKFNPINKETFKLGMLKISMPQVQTRIQVAQKIVTNSSMNNLLSSNVTILWHLTTNQNQILKLQRQPLAELVQVKRLSKAAIYLVRINLEVVVLN